jgi:2-dehydropantoate 2-reductase
MMRILIVGAGAVGGYFGARLAQSGRDVTFLVRPGRAERLKADGLKIISPKGNVTIVPRLAITGAISSSYDIVLLAVKAYALDQATVDFAPAVGSNTMIVPFLNGMRHLDLLTAQFGSERVLGGVCLVATSLKDDGSIEQMGDTQSLSYGEIPGGVTQRLEQLDRVLAGAGFEAHLSGDILREMWEKWIFLATLGGITCLLRGTVGEIEAVTGGAELARHLLAECSAVAVASGHAPTSDSIARIQAAVTAKGSDATSSMYRDLRAGKPVEADHIIGDLLTRARKLSLPAPLLATALVHLAVYQNRLRAHLPRDANQSKLTKLSSGVA